MDQLYTLYGIPASLWTSKVRSYLIQQQIPFVEKGVGLPYFRNHVMPTVQRFIMPVIESNDGIIVQDSADIIDYFEQQGATRYPAYPENSVLRALSFLFELFGGEGLLRPAMHYRWNFDETNLEFIRNDFSVGLADPALLEQKTKQAKYAIFDTASSRMRAAAVAFGVTPESIPTIESSYFEFLTLLTRHFEQFSFLLGAEPTIGDYGLIAPLFAHLGRDPYPSTLMKTHAGAVFRWVERMNSSERKYVEHEWVNESLLNEKQIPETLKHLMHFIAEEYVPEITAHVEYINCWLKERPEIKAGTNGLDKPQKRDIGFATFDWRGTSLTTIVMPYRIYLLQRLQDSVARSSEQEQQQIIQLFSQTGLLALLTLKTSRRVERKNYLEVWGESIHAKENN